MTDQRMNLDLIHEVLDVLDQHGYARYRTALTHAVTA